MGLRASCQQRISRIVPGHKNPNFFRWEILFLVECKHAASQKWSTCLMVNVCEGDLGFTIKLLAVHHLENRWYSSYATWADRPTYTSLETGIFYNYTTRIQCTILTFRLFFAMFCTLLVEKSLIWISILEDRKHRWQYNTCHCVFVGPKDFAMFQGGRIRHGCMFT